MALSLSAEDAAVIQCEGHPLGIKLVCADFVVSPMYWVPRGIYGGKVAFGSSIADGPLGALEQGLRWDTENEEWVLSEGVNTWNSGRIVNEYEHLTGPGSAIAEVFHIGIVEIAAAVAAQAVGSVAGSIGKGIADILDDTGTSGVVVKAASTVGAFPAAALVNAPTGSTIRVSQTSAVGSIQAFNLETTQYGSPSLPITCSVSQQGDSHKFAIYPLDDYSAPTVTLGSSLCSVGASPYTTVTVALDDAYTTSAGVFSYILRNTTDDIDAARGTLRIRPASNLTST